ncbi:hypothetical protein Tco_1193885 [Tanacetum coccineum]
MRQLGSAIRINFEHPSETIVFHNEDGNPARANIKQALGYLKDGDGDGNSQPHKGVKASANSDVMYSFTSAQDGNPLQDDVRLCLGDDLKKAQDHKKKVKTLLKYKNDEDTLTFLVDLGYSGLLHKYTNMFVDHMHQPWRTLAACINKCLFGKTASNDKLRKSRIDILWGIREKKSRRENMPYPRFTKVIIDYFLSKYKSLKKLKFQHFHTIKDDDVRLFPIKNHTRGSSCILLVQITPKEEQRDKVSQGIRRVKKKATISVDDNIVPEPDITLELGKYISLTEAEEEAVARQKLQGTFKISLPVENEASDIMKASRIAGVMLGRHLVGGSDEGTGTKLDDALLKTLERHTADLVEKYSMLPTPESSTNARTEEFDLKSALFKSMHKNKSANRNPANYRLYHALMEALIEDENAMDKEVADKVKDHKRKRDSDDEEDDDDEGPSDGSNQGDSTKRRRHDSSTFGSAQPPSKDSEKSTKNKLDSNTFAAKQPPAYTSSAWQITDTRDTPPGPSMQTTDHQSEQSSDDNPITDEGHVSDPEDTDNAHIPKVPAATWFKPIPEEERPATPEPEWTIPSNDYPEPENNWANVYATTYQDPEENKLQRKMGDIGSFIKWFCKRTGKKKLCKADLEGPTFNLVDLVNPEGHQILRNVYEPLPLGGPPGQLKAARYLDFRLEELVPYLWVESERDYDISAAYGITHWWFRRKEFYINKHREPSDRDAVRSHMRILSVISIKTYERYGYNYLREIVLRRADYKEYKISEKDFKNLHPNDFEDLFLLHLQDKLNHLPKSDKVNLHTAVNMWIRNIVIRKRVEDLQLGVESYQTKLNLEQPNWDASDFLFKEDYTIVNKPRAVIYRDRDDNKKMMRIDEVHKFSDGTLMRIRDKLDFMVKDFRLFKFNKGMETRKWTEDDKRRSEDFIEVIEKRLKIRRIFRSLESFVGGRLRDIDYRLISRTE